MDSTKQRKIGVSLERA